VSRTRVTLLITCVGGTLVPAALRLLRASSLFEYRLVGVNARGPVLAGNFLDAFHLVPAGDDPAYAEALLGVVARECAQVVLPWSDPEAEALSRRAEDLRGLGARPIVASPACLARIGDKAETYRNLVAAGVPCYSFPEPAVASIEAMYAYRVRAERPPQVGVCTLRDKPRAEAVLAKARREGCSEIVEFQAQELLKAYSLPVPETRLARTSSEAAAAAAEIGGPVVLKIASPQISHKSDVGGVVVNLKGEDAVKRAFQDITARAAGLRPDAYIIGCLVQAMAKKGAKECIVGFKRDPQFGPMIIFGLGGIYVEVLKDIAIRLVPLSKEDARDMIREIKSFPLLRGVRGEAAVDFASLEAILLAMSQLAEDFPEILEAEFNPVLAGPEGALVADVRVTVCSEEPAPDRGRLQAG